MGYWKREYTERRNGKPLFRPESKGEAAPEATPPPAEKEPDESQQSDSVPTTSP